VTSTSCKLKLIFSAYTDQAIDQGYRAVQELLIELTPKIFGIASSNEGLWQWRTRSRFRNRPNEL